MPALRQDIDPDGLLEYSVVYTDRSLNHMSKKFQTVMNDLSTSLKNVYNADAVAIVPGTGTYGMEAVARQLATDQTVLIIRNGFFSFRWTQILEKGRITDDVTVLTAHIGDNSDSIGQQQQFERAQALLLHITTADQLVDFLTLPAYELLTA